MEPPLSTLPTSNHSLSISLTSLHRITSIPTPTLDTSLFKPLNFSPKPQSPNRLCLIALSSSDSRGSDLSKGIPIEPSFAEENEQENQWRFDIQNAAVPPFVLAGVSRFTGDRAFFLLGFIACTISAAFTGLVIATVPTIFAMRRAATSLAKLADVACEELPSTIAAVRLSSMEISDLTLELSDLSEEISEGISKSTQAVQAAEDGIKQIGAAAHQQTISLIHERANFPVISLQPVVSGAAKKTSQIVGTVARTIMSIFSRQESNSAKFDDDGGGGKDGFDVLSDGTVQDSD